MPIQDITITTIGGVARELLAQGGDATVLGATSRGLFLILESGWVIYLSPEKYRGPLTLNFSGDGSEFRYLQNGDLARVSPDGLSIPKLALTIRYTNAPTWSAPSPSQQVLPPDQRYAQLHQVVQHALGLGNTSIVSALLPSLMGIDNEPDSQEKPFYGWVGGLSQAFKDRRIEGIVEAINPLLGLGSGLTPSGDDLIMGFSMVLARWGSVLASSLSVEELASWIDPLARQKTTSLSASLIACALQGQANERLLLALDGLLTGEPDAARCAALLASWGNTSGLDVLVGMTLVIKQ